jgi:hypothetical protein
MTGRWRPCSPTQKRSDTFKGLKGRQRWHLQARVVASEAAVHALLVRQHESYLLMNVRPLPHPICYRVHARTGDLTSQVFCQNMLEMAARITTCAYQH